MSEPVSITGWSWGAVGTWVTAFVALFGFLGIVARLTIPWRKMSIERDENMTTHLTARVTHLEKILDKERALRDAEQRAHGHQIANLTQALDLMIELLEVAPERAPDIVLRVRNMRARQVQTEAMEKSAIIALRVDPVTD